MRLEFTPEARRDVLDIRDWYGDLVPGLGAEFVRAVEVSAASVERFPAAFPRVHGDIRKAIVRRFPYSLLYTIGSERVVVLGCFHQRRNPVSWQR